MSDFSIGFITGAVITLIIGELMTWHLLRLLKKCKSKPEIAPEDDADWWKTQ